MSEPRQKVIDVLSEIYWAEIGAVGVYMDQYVKCEGKGYTQLAGILEKDAIDEMKHAELLSKRVIFLGGRLVNKKHMLPVVEQEDILEMVKMNFTIEKEAIERLNKGISLCFAEGDNGSRMLLDEILKAEEMHLDDLESMIDNIQKYGDAYITTHLM